MPAVLVACGGRGPSEGALDAAVDSGAETGGDVVSTVDHAPAFDATSEAMVALDLADASLVDATSDAIAAPPGPCVAGGRPIADGTSCGTDEVCRGGSCVVCVAGLRCDPGNPCHVGKTDCRPGTPACVDTSANVPDGAKCGDNQVCSGGACVACAEGTPCAYSDTFCTLTGALACGTGAPVCAPATTRPDGTTCGDDAICLGGSCQTQLTVTPPSVAVAAPVQGTFSGTLASLTDVLATDGPGDFGVIIDWGDGTTSAGTVTATGTRTFSIGGTHRFGGSGGVNVTVTVKANRSENRASATVSVAVGLHLVPSSWSTTDVVWDPSGRIVYASYAGLYAVHPSDAVPTLLTSDASVSVTCDGQRDLWFGEYSGGIGSLAPNASSPSVFPSQTVFSHLAIGSDGSVWFAAAAALGRVAADGVVTTFPLPFVELYPEAMTLGPDGNIWVAGSTEQGTQLVEVTPQGTITAFASTDLLALAAGPDGSLWGAAGAEASIVQISLTGSIVATYPVAPPSMVPSALAFAADGSLWYGGAGAVTRREPGGDETTYVMPGTVVNALAVDPSGNVWFANEACLPDCGYGWIEP